MELTRLATARLGKTVIELEDVSLAVPVSGQAGGGERPLLEHVTWQLGPGDRVGIAGVNGSGKTSLLNVLAGTSGPGIAAEGTVVRGRTVRLAYLSQELAELDPEQRVREAVEEVRLRIRVGDRELSAAQLLERLGFAPGRQWIRVGDLSGGERRRVQLLRLLMDEPNVLLLDEPTNDLDIETLTELEDLLDDWPGTLVVVSHDRYFLERVTEHVVALLADGRLSFLGGGVDEYLDRIRAARGGPAGGAGAGTRSPPSPAGGPGGRTGRPAGRERGRLRTAHLAGGGATGGPGGEIGSGGPLADGRLRAGRLNPSRPLASFRVEGGEQDAHHVRQVPAIVGVQPGQQRPLTAEQVSQGRVHLLPAQVGQRDQDPALVPGIGFPADQALAHQPVDPVGHGAGGHQGGAEQRARGQLERRPLPAQRGEHVELPRLEPVIGERPAPRDVQVPGQPGDPAEYLHGLDVQVRSLGPPGDHQVIHLVAQHGRLEDPGSGIRGIARRDGPPGPSRKIARGNGPPRRSGKRDAGTGSLGHY